MHKLTLMSTMQWDKFYKYKLIEVFVNEQRIKGQKHCFYLCLNGYFEEAYQILFIRRLNYAEVINHPNCEW